VTLWIALAFATPHPDEPFTVAATLTNRAGFLEALGQKTIAYRATSDGAVAWLVGAWSYDREPHYVPPGQGPQAGDYLRGRLLLHRTVHTAVRYDLANGVATRCDLDVVHFVAPDGAVTRSEPTPDGMTDPIEGETFWQGALAPELRRSTSGFDPAIGHEAEAALARCGPDDF
jgi:hypothetical protein